MDTFLQVLASGLMLGALFAIVSIGLTLIFGIVKVVNFAHACSCARCTYGGVGDVLIGQDLLDGLLGLIKNSCGPAESKEFRFR